MTAEIYQGVRQGCPVSPTLFNVHLDEVIQRVLYTLKVKVKVKLKLSLCLRKHDAMKTYWGSGGIAPRLLDLGTRWKWVVSFTHRPRYPQGKSPWYPLKRRLGGPQMISLLCYLSTNI
jgi:hypothetical protein